jgi:predicted GNAT superfamily acetyltransferase
MSELCVARLTEFSEFDACVELQQKTWQYSAGELLPRRVFFLAEKLGGHVLGAYDGESLVGFNLGMPAQRRGIGYIHSQMLAVLPEYRNTGVGRRMKLLQRDIALEQGVRVIEWTYDPLEIKNSFFNLARLGVISRKYIPDFYGVSTSPLQGGLPTDRLYAEWWIDSDHTKAVLSGEQSAEKVVATVSVPAQIYAWKAERDHRAHEVQTANRTLLQKYFADGLAIVGYTREADGGGTYLLGEAPAQIQDQTF